MNFGNIGVLWGTLGNFGELWKLFENFGKLWELLRTLGNVGELLGIFGDLWGTLGNFMELWGDGFRERGEVASNCSCLILPPLASHFMATHQSAICLLDFSVGSPLRQ